MLSIVLAALVVGVARADDGGVCCFYPETPDRCEVGCEVPADPTNYCAESKSNCENDCLHVWCAPSGPTAVPTPVDGFCCFSPETPERCGENLDACQNVAPADNYCAQSRKNCEEDCTDPSGRPHVWCSETTREPTPAPAPTETNVQSPGFVFTDDVFTTGYWDCCKPSCAWPGKGNVNQPAYSCGRDGQSPFVASVEPSLCDDGVTLAPDGGVGSCDAYSPFVYNDIVTMGFSAIGTGKIPGLEGDQNCGQCFELTWKAGAVEGPGAHPDILGKRHVVQVLNVGSDVDHSFDLQIPTAGRGFFQDACGKQYPGFDDDVFDCANPYGGCDTLDECALLPQGQKAGCEWRYARRDDGTLIYGWRQENGLTDNPLADFRRVKCPDELKHISGFYALDEDQYPEPNLDVASPAPTFHTPAPSSAS